MSRLIGTLNVYIFGDDDKDIEEAAEIIKGVLEKSKKNRSLGAVTLDYESDIDIDDAEDEED